MNHSISDCSPQVLAIPTAKWPLWCAGALLGMLAAGQWNSYVVKNIGMFLSSSGKWEYI